MLSGNKFYSCSWSKHGRHACADGMVHTAQCAHDSGEMLASSHARMGGMQVQPQSSLYVRSISEGFSSTQRMQPRGGSHAKTPDTSSRRNSRATPVPGSLDVDGKGTTLPEASAASTQAAEEVWPVDIAQNVQLSLHRKASHPQRDNMHPSTATDNTLIQVQASLSSLHGVVAIQLIVLHTIDDFLLL
jgi:hypothetical protein